MTFIVRNLGTSGALFESSESQQGATRARKGLSHGLGGITQQIELHQRRTCLQDLYQIIIA